jgi:hypothetical protein
VKKSVFLALVAIVLSACSSAPELRAPADYPRLSVKADEENTLAFAEPKAQFGKYRKVYFAPVKIQALDRDSMKEVDPAEAKAIAALAEKTFRESLARYYPLADRPAEDVLTLRFRIIDLKPTDAAQAVMLVPPFALINLVSSKGAFTGSITLAGEFFEGNASRPSAAFVAFRSRPGVDAASAFGKWTAVEKVIANGAERLATDLNNTRQR